MKKIDIELNSTSHTQVNIHLQRPLESRSSQVGKTIRIEKPLAFPALTDLRAFIVHNFEIIRHSLSGQVEDTDRLPLKEIADLRWNLLEQGTPVHLMRNAIDSVLKNPHQGTLDRQERLKLRDYATGFVAGDTELNQAA